MNLAPLLVTVCLSLGLSCVIFILRDRLQLHRELRPMRVTEPRRRLKAAVFPVSRLPSIYH